MWDGFSGEKVDVRVDEKCGPYIMIPPAAIERIAEVLRRNDIAFTVEDGATHACIGTPEAAVIEFDRSADVRKIQQVLDAVQ